MSLLVDPLAALFRSGLARQSPLLLDATDVAVELLPPLARIVVTRRFRNSEERLIEAVLTLPAAADREIVHALTVTIAGDVYRAHAEAGDRAQSLYADALLEGRRAILHERLANGAQLISISGIAPGADVAVCIESIRPLDRMADGSAMLSIALTADPRPLNRRLSEADEMLTRAYRHAATLAVTGHGLSVSAGNPPGAIETEQPLPVDCAAPVVLRITAADGASLDHSHDSAGVWRASAELEASAPLLPAFPDAGDAAAQGDWILGRVHFGQHRIEVIAPRPGNPAASPATRAMSAFAAGTIVAAAARFDVAALRRAADILSDDTHLVFVGDAGMLPDAIPVLRKLALPEPDAGFESLSLEEEPPEPEVESRSRTPDLPPERGTIAGARPPTYYWLLWSPALVLILWLLAALRYIPLPLGALTIIFIALMLLNAVRFFPRPGNPVRRRLPLLALLLLPPLVSVLAGPLGLIEISWHAEERERMVVFQGWLLVASAVLPLLLLPALRGGRAFALVIGILAFVASFFVTATAAILNMPGA